MCADDKTFNRLSVPFSSLANFLRKLANLGDGAESDICGRYETPFAGKYINLFWFTSLKGTSAGVDAVEMKTSEFFRVRENMFFETVVAELRKCELV